MATVYSLICWGGRTGKTVSLSATTDVVTLTNHGLRNGTKLWPSGTLPSELNTSTPVYARSTGANTFTLHASSAGAIASTGQILFAGSSTYAAVVLKSDLVANAASALAVYGLSDLSRWGSSGSEFIYDSLQNCLTARTAAATSLTDEVVEIGEAFNDIFNNQLVVGTRAPTFTIESKINGIQTPGFHGGNPNGGFRYTSTNVGGTYTPNQYNTTVDGIEFCTDSTSSGGYSAITPGSLSFNTVIKNCIINNLNTGAFYGVYIDKAIQFYNNIIIGFVGTTYGAMYVVSGLGCYVYNNLITKNGIGFKANDSTQGMFYNNISVGNTSNWRASGTFQSTRCIGNMGDATADKISFTATAASTLLACVSAPLQNVNSIVFLTTTGTLPTIAGVPLSTSVGYFIRSVSGNNITLGLTYNGAALVFDGVGTGTHYLNLVWSSVQPVSAEVDFTTPNSVFQDYANNDFRPAGTGATPNAAAVQVDNAVDVLGLVPLDMLGKERPQYRNGAAEYKDVGPFEYDFGYTRPTSNYRGLAFTDLVSGSTLKVFETGTTTELFSDTSTSTSETWSENSSGSKTVDYTIFKDGYVPIRVTGITVTGASSGGIVTTPIQQRVSRAYQASSGLTYGSTATINTGTKQFATTVTTTIQNYYSFCCEAWRTESALKNTAFPLSENGPNSFQLSDNWVFSSGSIAYLSRDGMRTVNSSGTITGVWAAILSVGVPSGMQVRYQQQDGSGTTNAANTGNMDQLIKIYENGSFDYTEHLALKVQADGYDQAEFDLVSTFGTLEDQFYVAGLSPVANGIASGTVTGVTITDHGASPVTWHSKVFSITVTDTTGHTGGQILQYVRGLNSFNYHDLVQTNGTEYKTVRGNLYGDTGAALKGVRVVKSDGTTSHADFNLHTADDGTTYIPPLPPAAAESTILADSRVQLFNVTTNTEIDNAFETGTSYSYVITTEASAGDVLRLRVCKLGKEAGGAFAVWGASGATFLITQPASAEYATWGIDGSMVTEFSGDVTGHIYIEANDLDGATTKTRLGAWYSWVLTTEVGIRHFFGAVTYISAAAIRINTDIADILIENVNASTALRFTDLSVRLYRSDGSSVIAPTSYSVHNDYSGVPDVVETGVSGLTGSESAQLMALPSSTATASAILAAAQITPIHADVQKMNSAEVIGDGTVGNDWRGLGVPPTVV